MNKETFENKLKAAQIFKNHESGMCEYWEGYINGLQSNFRGLNSNHFKSLALGVDFGENYQQALYHTGYRFAFFNDNELYQYTCPDCGQSMFFDRIILVKKYAVYSCTCNQSIHFNIFTGEWSH